MRAGRRNVPVPGACGLLLVLLLAKVMVLWHAAPSSPPGAWPALVWQDVAVAIAAAMVERAAGGRRWFWSVYAAAIAWIAINVPAAIVLDSWLTRPMLRAARGTIGDSIAYYVTPANVGRIAAVAAIGVLVPWFLKRRALPAWALPVAAVVATAGAVMPPPALAGFERNAITAALALPRMAAAPAPALSPDWRDSPFETPADAASPGAGHLERLRGAAAGMNVMIVILESTAAQYLGLYGAIEDPMPRLTRLAARGVVFDAAFAVYPESVKGLYAALCARSPRLGAPMEASLDGPCANLPAAMSAAGYRTGLFHSGRFGYLGMDRLVASQRFDTAEDAGAIGGVVQSSFGVDEPSTVARLLGWIDADNTRPFFAVYMPAAGHHPYATSGPGPFPGAADFDRYRNALHEADAALGALVDGAHARGLLARTAFLIFGDHGEAFGQHPGNIGHTLRIDAENVRVPLVLVVPGRADPARVAAPASVLDLAPTVLDLIGRPAPAGIEGASLLSDRARVAPYFTDYARDWLGLRDGCWSYRYDRAAGASSLFNACDDPAETRDRSAGEPRRTATYRSLLTRWK